MSSTAVDKKPFNTSPDKPHVGRTCKLTPDLQDAFCKFIRDGNNITTACHGVGITPGGAYFNWVQLASEEEEQGIFGTFRAFNDAVKKAQAEFRNEMVNLIVDAANKRLPNTWPAAAWLLERTWPEEYAQAPQLRISGTIQHDHTLKGVMDRVALYEAAQEPKALAPGIIEGKVLNGAEGSRTDLDKEPLKTASD